MIIDDDNQSYISDHSSIESTHFHEPLAAKPISPQSFSADTESKFKLSAFITSSGNYSSIKNG